MGHNTLAYAVIACTSYLLCHGMSSAQTLNEIAFRNADPSDGRTLTMEETILSRELSPSIPSYRWSEDGKGLIAAKGDSCTIMDIRDMSTSPYVQSDSKESGLPDNAADITPGKGGNVAYTLGKSLYYTDMKGISYPVAISGNDNITYGQTVSRNEFGITGGIFWSPDGKRIAFYRKDESLVSSFPLLDIGSRTGTLREIKYPMAGMASENVRLGIYDLASATTSYVAADDFGYDQYLTNVTWSPDSRHIFISVLDRSQKHMRLNMYDAQTGKFERTILTEDNSRYVEPLDPLYFIEGSNDTFIYRTANRDGWRNLYLCDTEGNIRRLTVTDADVQYVANDGKYVYYTSAEVSPVENHLFRTAIRGGKPERLTSETGWHEILMSPDCSMFVDTYSNITTPGNVVLHRSDGKAIRQLHTAADPVVGRAYGRISLGTVRSADGKYDNYYRLILPKDFDPARKYPVILYVYGGPHSQLVKNTWLAELRRWEMYMAQRGYIVYVQDNRGTQNRGLEFEQAIHGQCGQAEMADQMEGIRMLMGLPYVDRDRIGVHGWSYGGFMTISLITNYPEVFKVAVAGGPVIDWKWYEVMYGERYMDSPQTNAEGYGKVSLTAKAGDLKGKLLICQGAVDNVVVWEHSLSFIQECIAHNVQVDYFPYPCAEHNVLGKHRVHLMDKVSMYFNDYL